MSSFQIARTHPVLQDADIKCTFDNILSMTDAEFEQYVTHMRTTFLRYWDEEGLPPRRGWTIDGIEDDFAKLAGYPVHEFWATDEQTGARVIRNTTTLGNSVNAWNAGRMYETRINYSLKDDGRSIYDFFKRPELFARYLPYARRHFLRDSFYLFASSVLERTALPYYPELVPETGVAYVRAFADKVRGYHTHELLIEPVLVTQSGGYSGYGGKLHAHAPLSLSYDEFCAEIVNDRLPPITRRNIQTKHLTPAYRFHVRQYARGQRVFPALFRSFRISMCQYAVNFPPATAKLLYESFLSHVDTPVVRVWDPSSGWAGRLLGAMSYNRQLPSGQMQSLAYYGTDPNSSFYTERESVYDVIRDTYNRVRMGLSMFDEPHQATVYQLGSEEFHTTEAFCTHMGGGDLVFTSPPYFNREAYSEDDAQSYKKYNNYERWRDGFLRPTIQNAYAFLNHERYFLWNIADLKMGKNYLPLEADSRRIAEETGFVYKETVYMALANMPGANRVSKTGEATAKNSVRVKGRLMKAEPVFVFWKP
jgi:hypothetical protein